MYRVRAMTVPLEPAQCPSMSDQGNASRIHRDRDSSKAQRKRQPTKPAAKGSSNNRVAGERRDSSARHSATTVAVRLTVDFRASLPMAGQAARAAVPVACH